MRPKQVNNVIQVMSKTRTADGKGEGNSERGGASQRPKRRRNEKEIDGEDGRKRGKGASVETEAITRRTVFPSPLLAAALMGESGRCESALSCQQSHPVSSLTPSSTGCSL